MTEKTRFYTGIIFLVQAVSSLILSCLTCREKPFMSGMAMLSALLGGLVGILHLSESKKDAAQSRKITAARDACAAWDTDFLPEENI